MDAAQDGKASGRSRSRATRTGFGSPAFGTGCACAAGSRLLVRNRFAVSPRCIAMAVLIGGLSFINFVLWLIQVALLGRKIDRTKIEARSDLRDRPLAFRHDPAARVAGARPAAHVSRHLRLLRAEPFSGVGLVDEAVSEVAAAVAAADGQHAGRLGPPAGRRVRPVQHGRSLALPDHRLSQPSAAVSGVSRLPRRAGAGLGPLEAGVALVPQVHHAAEPEADRAEVAAAHRPHPHAAGDVPQGEVRPHRPRPVRHLPLDGQSLEAALPRRGPAGADLRGPGGARLHDLHADVRRLRARPRPDRSGPVLRGPLRGAGRRPDRADAAGLRANWN